MRTQANETENRKISIEKNCVSLKISIKVKNLEPGYTKIKQETMRVTDIKNENGVLTTDSMGIKRISKENNEKMCRTESLKDTNC